MDTLSHTHIFSYTCLNFPSALQRFYDCLLRKINRFVVDAPWFEYWSGYPFPFPGDLPNPETEPASPACQADSLPLSHLRSPGLETGTLQMWLVENLKIKSSQIWGGLKVRDWRLCKKRKERLGAQRDTHGKKAKKTEAGAGGMWPQAKECLEAEGTARGQEGRFPRIFRGSNSPADTWTLGFLPPELGGSKPLLLEATRFVTAPGDAKRALCWLLQPAHPFPPLVAPLLPTRSAFSSF